MLRDHRPIDYRGRGIVEAFPEVTDISCDVDDNEVEGCIVQTGDGELFEVDVDEVQVTDGTEFSSAPHMGGTYEGTQYEMMTSETEFTSDYSGVWFDLTGMEPDAVGETCVIANTEDGTPMVCGDEQTPLAHLDPSGEEIDGSERPFREPEDYQRRGV